MKKKKTNKFLYDLWKGMVNASLICGILLYLFVAIIIYIQQGRSFNLYVVLIMWAIYMSAYPQIAMEVKKWKEMI